MHAGAVPACVIVTVCVATLRVPVRPAEPVLAATVYWTAPFPDPLAPAVMVIHVAWLVAAQTQPGCVVTATLPEDAVAGYDAEFGSMLYKQGDAVPLCVMVTVCPATVIVPVRPAEAALAATAYCAVPLPAPEAPAVIRIHGA